MTAKKMTKTQMAARANEYRVKLAAQMGAVAGGTETSITSLMDEIMETLGLSHFADRAGSPFVGLINSARHGYRPTLRGDIDPLYTVLADAYDFEQARRGYATRAYRGN